MQIRLKKGPLRHRLGCRRPDGTWTEVDVGPQLPAHDLAHYVAERALGMEGGFFGLVASGMALPEIYDPRTLPESVARTLSVAELWARALGAASMGSCSPQEMRALILAEQPDQLVPSDAALEAMSSRMGELLSAWEALAPGEELVLDW
jgi:hypothetical protein